MFTWMAKKVLRSRSSIVQIGGQAISKMLSGVLEREFIKKEINWSGRSSCLLLSFDVDFPEDALALPRIVELLTPHQIGASFACVGRWVQDYPQAHQAVIEAGYELFNHSFSHPELINSPDHFVSFRDDLNERRWHELSLPEKKREIYRCQEIVRQRLGYDMQGFRAPHFGNVQIDELYPVLEELGLSYSSSKLAPRGNLLGVPVMEGTVLEIPVTTCPRHPFTSLDSWHAYYARGGWHRDDFFETLEEQFRRAIQNRGLTCIYLDPKDSDRLDFARLFALIASLAEKCWTPNYADFASWWRNEHGVGAQA